MCRPNIDILYNCSKIISCKINVYNDRKLNNLNFTLEGHIVNREGQIKVHSENIFPIIKKWLYSDKDIFLRELISNACDAIQKLQRLQGIGEATQDNFTPRVTVCVDKENKTLKNLKY